MALNDIPTSSLANTADRKALLIDALLQILPAKNILHEIAELKPYECDGLAAYTQLPLAVALPENTDQVQRIVCIAQKLNVPIVPRGAGTGLSGGAVPHPDGLVLSFGKMDKILDIDLKNRCATVQPGVRNLHVSDQTRPFGLYFAPDPSSQIACSIGGNVAENAGGLHCLKYGLTVNNILGLKVILSNGKLVEIGGKSLDNNGFNLLSLFIGSEGLLGITVEITVKLLPVPTEEKVLLAGFDKVSDAAMCVSDIISAGILPAGLEMMDQFTLQAAEDYAHCGYPKHCKAILLCEVDGVREEVVEQMIQVEKIAQANNATFLKQSNSDEERQKLWLGRKSAFPAIGKLAPDYYCMDGTIPRRHLSTVLEKIQKLSEDYELPVANVFHAGDGNLHPLILFDSGIEGSLERVEELGGKILQLCIDCGGTISGEHGIGIEKIGQMCGQFNAHELKQFHKVKKAIDPFIIFNPEKAIPTLHRCSEFGHMHVKNNQIPHPEIPRF